MTDFGIAHIQSSELTQVGTIMGTPYYMAPEQYLGMRVDGRTDLYSAGVLLFCLLTGKKPFDGSREQLAYSICNVPAPLASTVAPGRVPSALDDVVATALSKKPEDRYPSAVAFKKALLAAHAAPVSDVVSEETRIIDSGPRRDAFDQPTPKTNTGSSGMGSDSAPPTGWDPTLLKKVEQQLAVFVGPFAQVMVKKAAKSTQDMENLYSRLAGELESIEERKKFLRGLTHIDSAGAKTQMAGTQSQLGPSDKSVYFHDATVSTHEPITSDTIEAASRLLATFLGPVAKVLAKRAAPLCTTRRQFYSRLAENLSDRDERDRFLRMIASSI